VIVAARRVERAEALVRDLRRRVGTKLVAVDLTALRPDGGEAEPWLGDVGLVVNATSVGMKGEPFFPLAFGATGPSCFFYDLIYTARRTPFLAAAARLRRPVANGLGMLLHQGAAAFEIWTGVEAPLDVMRRALARNP